MEFVRNISLTPVLLTDPDSDSYKRLIQYRRNIPCISWESVEITALDDVLGSVNEGSCDGLHAEHSELEDVVTHLLGSQEKSSLDTKQFLVVMVKFPFRIQAL